MGTNLRTVNVHRPVATFGSRAVPMACPSMGMQLWYVFLLSLLISCLLPYWRFCFLSAFAFALVLREVRSPA